MPVAAHEVEAALGYRFQDGSLFARALVHRSYLDENPGLESNETLEFLGDAVLQLAATDHLMAAHGGLPEGQLAKVRAAAVSEPTLAGIARRLGIGEALALGRGEEMTGGRDKPSLLSDGFEAILGAVYLDAGFEAARDVVLRHLAPILDARALDPGQHDYKSRLQELLAGDGLQPEYEITATGPDHERVFTAVVRVEERHLGSGSGTSKRRAEQAAARGALETIESG